MTSQFTVGETVRHRDTARTATIRSYDSESDTYEIQFHDHHTWRDGVHSSELDQPIYSATSADAMMGTTVGAPAAGISVPIGQCIELINAAVAFRVASRESSELYRSGRYATEADKDRIADAYLETQRHLYNIIEALPEQEN